MKNSLKNLILTFTIGSALIGCQKNLGSDPAPSSAAMEVLPARISENTAQYVPNEIVVKFKNDVNDETLNNMMAKTKSTSFTHIFTEAMKNSGEKTGIVLMKTNGSVKETIDYLKKQDNVEYAEPNYIYQKTELANDTYYNSGALWGTYSATSNPANAFGTGAVDAWKNNHTGSKSIYVAILDEGYMYNHEDLAPNAGTNLKEIPNNGKDDDRNGYIDDVYGWNFESNTNSIFNGLIDNHGTHVAGTIGAAGKNGIGVAGICWNVKFIGAKFIGQNGGTLTNAIKAIDYITNLKTNNGMNIVAINSSWGGVGFSTAMMAAIERANKAGILFVAAAGNSAANNDATPFYPASFTNNNIISVAALTSSGDLASFSCYGKTSVDIAAPGQSIVSTVPATLTTGAIGSGYANYSGTSMAAPQVSGAIALYASTHASASITTIKNAILSTATPTTSMAGKCVSGGRLNVSTF